MKRSKNTGVVIFALGIIMVITAVCLLLYNYNESRYAGEVSGEILEEMQVVIPEETDSLPETAVSEYNPLLENFEELQTIWVEGDEYIGYLSIPAIGLELPVMSDWSYEKLRTAPCRQFGTTAADLVIAGHNYERHFGKLSSLAIGDVVRFKDVEGNSYHYTVSSVEIVNPMDTERIQYSEKELVLYTCTYGGKQRVCVFCDMQSHQS